MDVIDIDRKFAYRHKSGDWLHLAIRCWKDTGEITDVYGYRVEDLLVASLYSAKNVLEDTFACMKNHGKLGTTPEEWELVEFEVTYTEIKPDTA
jgi:hypothetical protein